MEFHKGLSLVRYYFYYLLIICQTRLLYSSLVDSTLSTSFAEENALEFTLTLTHQLNNVNNCLISNHICINADKTKYMIFSYRKQLHLTNIKIGSETIEETNNVKFLGIIFDKHLTFKNHADVIARKISKSVGILFKLSKYLPLVILKT